MGGSGRDRRPRSEWELGGASGDAVRPAALELTEVVPRRGCTVATTVVVVALVAVVLVVRFLSSNADPGPATLSYDPLCQHVNVWGGGRSDTLEDVDPQEWTAMTRGLPSGTAGDYEAPLTRADDEVIVHLADRTVELRVPGFSWTTCDVG